MRNVQRLSAGALALVFAGTAALAGVETYQIDTGHSSVEFKIRHLVAKTGGRFEKFTGTVEIDPDNLAATKVTAVIETGSLNTAQADRDNHLRSAEFFDVQKHPEMKFESTSYTPKGKETGTLKGKLTLLGVTKPVELEVEVLGFAPDPWGGHRGGFSAHTTINRKDFGMVWNKTLDQGGFVLGDEVEIRIELETKRQKAADAAQD
jgi:polyisoprenoid-binding protein YceI